MDNPVNKKSVFKLKVILQELSQDGNELMTNCGSLIENALSLADSLFHILCLSSSEKTELEVLATQLWNKAVMLKSKKSLSLLYLAKVRHISFKVVTHLFESSNDEATLKKHIIMALKTARAWIDCKEWKNAEDVLHVFQKAVQKLEHIVVEKKTFSLTSEDVLKKEKYELDKDFFQGLCLAAEVKLSQSKQNEAMNIFSKAKELMQRTFPNEAGYLSLLCYNFGVDCFNDKHFADGIFWLKESYDLGKDTDGFSKNTQAITLRLLANCYLEEKNANWIEKALDAVMLANKIESHPAGFFLKLQLSVLDDHSNLIFASFQELLNHEDSGMDLVLNSIGLLKKHQKFSVVFEMRLDILKKFHLHPDYGLLLVSLLDTFLVDIDGIYGKMFSQECIEAHNTDNRLDGPTLKRFHILFWSRAAEMFEKEDYNEALVWYNYSLSLYSSMCPTQPNLGKLQRNLATCYLMAGDTDKALAALEVSDKCEPKNAHTHFIFFKVALVMNDFEKALASLHNLVEYAASSEDANNIISLAAQTALEQGKSELAIPALECLISHSKDNSLILVAIRCLLKLLITQMEETNRFDVSKAINMIRTAYNKILVKNDEEDSLSTELHDEALWFMKITWNLAIKQNDDLFAAKELFNLSYQLISLCPMNLDNFTHGNRCLLLSCAAGLQISRHDHNNTQVQEVLAEVLKNIEEYRQREKKAEKFLWAHGTQKNSAEEVKYLILYEYEALLKLKDPRAESVIDKALLSIPDPKIFHTMAAIALDSSVHNVQLGMKVLKISIRLHLESASPDYVKCSADLRNLIELAMSRHEEEEAFIYLEEAVEVLNNAKDVYPEIEIVWLMTKSWSFGLQQYNFCKYDAAEKWCSMSIKFLKYLTCSKENYEEQMMLLYQELMSHLEKKHC